MSDEGVLLVPKHYSYMGVRVDAKGKRVHSWFVVEDDKSFVFGKNITSFASVGQMFLVHEVGDSSIRTGGDKAPRYVGKHQDSEMVVRWAIADEVAREALASKAMATKAANESAPLDELMTPILKAARKMNDTERRAFLALLASKVMYA